MQGAHNLAPGLPRGLRTTASCLLCRRDAEPSSELCKHHLAAKNNLESAYIAWKEGYGELSWKDYLRRVRSRSETGQWAKEVADLLAKRAADGP